MRLSISNRWQCASEEYAAPELVATGGMGEVYRATDSVLDRTVAVKLLADRYAVRTRLERDFAARHAQRRGSRRPRTS